jgi:hypothetical protein
MRSFAPKQKQARGSGSTLVPTAPGLIPSLQHTGGKQAIRQLLRAPAGLVSRKASPQDEALKKDAVKWHVTQQLHVAGLLDKGRRIKPDPSKGPLDPDNLFHNSVELVDDGRIRLSILTPTHDWKTRNPGKTGQRAFFDWRVKYRKTGGDYPADPADTSTDKGLSFVDLGTPATATALTKTLQVPGVVNLFTGNALPGDEPFAPITEFELRQSLVHEAQHVADLNLAKLLDTTLEPWKFAFEAYKNEFRAHWIQPVPPPPVCQGGNCIGVPSEARLGSEKDPAGNKTRLSKDCKACPAAGPSSKPGKSPATTKFKNKRQENIFLHLVSRYPDRQFDCFYVCSSDFKDAVDAFALPASVNLINSTRLMNVNLALQTVKPSMKRADLNDFVKALSSLDALDWAFLEKRELSAPFWEMVNLNAPKDVQDGLNVLVTRAAAKGVNATDIESALAGKLKP